MPLKKHHKIMIGGVSSMIIIFVIVNSIFLYLLFAKLNFSFNALETDIKQIKMDTQSQINELTTNLIQTKETLLSLDESLKTEISQLKASASADFSGVIEDAIESVVTIRTDAAQGTGFIITNQGHLVTNAHVLADGRRIAILTSNQEIVEAQFIGYNAEFDLALLKIQGNYDELKLADSDDVQVGEKVIAIGNPLGLQFSVSEGIVSATHRQGINGINAYIQTDAALNPGNSGGPLINTQGEVIGINNFKIGGGESLGFALESNYIEDVVNSIAQEQLGESLL